MEEGGILRHLLDIKMTRALYFPSFFFFNAFSVGISILTVIDVKH